MVRHGSAKPLSPGSNPGAASISRKIALFCAGVAELADAHDSKSCGEIRVGSTPTTGIPKPYIYVDLTPTSRSVKLAFFRGLGSMRRFKIVRSDNYATYTFSYSHYSSSRRMGEGISLKEDYCLTIQLAGVLYAIITYLYYKKFLLCTDPNEEDNQAWLNE